MTHAELARRNYELAPKISQYDWRVTILFYAAVHATNHMLFGGKDVRSEYDHSRRATDIERHAELRKKSARYRELFRLSRTARYHAWDLPLLESQAKRAALLAEEILSFCGIIGAATSAPPAPGGTSPS